MPEFGGRPSPARLLDAERIGRKRLSGWQLCPQHPPTLLCLAGSREALCGPFFIFFFFFLVSSL